MSIHQQRSAGGATRTRWIVIGAVLVILVIVLVLALAFSGGGGGSTSY